MHVKEYTRTHRHGSWGDEGHRARTRVTAAVARSALGWPRKSLPGRSPLLARLGTPPISLLISLR